MGPRAGECALPSPGKVAVPVWGGGRALLLCLLAGRSATLAFLGVKAVRSDPGSGPGRSGHPVPSSSHPPGFRDGSLSFALAGSVSPEV